MAPSIRLRLGQTTTTCTRVCVHGGANFARIGADVTYLLYGDLNVLKRLAGQRAHLVGALKRRTIRISSVVAETQLAPGKLPGIDTFRGDTVKNFLIRILLAVAVTLVAFGLASSAHAQQSDEDPAPATSRQPQFPTAPHSSQQQRDVPAPSSTGHWRSLKDPITKMSYQEALAFAGRMVQEQSRLV